jgi:hypothetical protein
MVGLVIAAYFSMGDGGCSTSNSANRTYSFYRQDVCGSNAPFYWKADSVGRKFKIDVKTGVKWTAFLEGTYSEPILLPCPSDPESFYVVQEIHD